MSFPSFLILNINNHEVISLEKLREITGEKESKWRHYYILYMISVQNFNLCVILKMCFYMQMQKYVHPGKAIRLLQMRVFGAKWCHLG